MGTDQEYQHTESAGAYADMCAADSVLDLIGATPLVRLSRLFRHREAVVLGKLESRNPGGSIKDRVAVNLIDRAEQQGLLRPGGHIVEPTSGNTGVGLAIVAALRGYRCTFTVPDKVAPEKIALLRAYGADVVVCPTAVPADHPDSYYAVARRIADEDPAAFRPDQYANPANPEAHTQTTAPEIWDDTAGKVTHLVAGAGTGGTLGGIGRYLKERNSSVVVIAADPVGSVYSGGTGDPYLVEGIGEDFWPSNWDGDVVDQIVTVTDAESFAWARKAAREEGLLLGGSCGAALAAADVVATDAPAGSVIVVILPDSGRGYLSKVYNDTWMLENGFIEAGGSGPTVRDLLERTKTPRMTLVHEHTPTAEAVEIMARYDVTHLAVASIPNPVVASQVIGAVSVRGLIDRIRSGEATVGAGDEVLVRAGIGETVEAVLRRRGAHGVVLVSDNGRPVAVLDVADLERKLLDDLL